MMNYLLDILSFVFNVIDKISSYQIVLDMILLSCIMTNLIYLIFLMVLNDRNLILDMILCAS